MSKRKIQWTRDFKLQALSRMEDAPTVTALAAELGVCREMLYKWRRTYQSGGAEALQAIGRPLNTSRPVDEAFAPSVIMSPEQRRIEELQRKIGQQQLDLDFFARPCGRSGSNARRQACLARQHLRGDPRDDAAARPCGDRAAMPAGRDQPGWLLPALAGFGAAPGGNGVAR